MSINLKEHHLSFNVPVFVRANMILESGNSFDYSEVVAIQKELEEYEAQVRDLRHRIFRATYSDMVSMFVESIDENIVQEHLQ